MENKDTFYINPESLRKLGTDPAAGVNYLLSKMAVTINPAHVKTLQVLREQPSVASS
jgi:hypothetical protein